MAFAKIPVRETVMSRSNGVPNLNTLHHLSFSRADRHSLMTIRLPGEEGVEAGHHERQRRSRSNDPCRHHYEFHDGDLRLNCRDQPGMRPQSFMGDRSPSDEAIEGR